MFVFLEIFSICFVFIGIGSFVGSVLWCLVLDWEFERNEVWWYLVFLGFFFIFCSNRLVVFFVGVLFWIK